MGIKNNETNQNAMKNTFDHIFNPLFDSPYSAKTTVSDMWKKHFPAYLKFGQSKDILPNQWKLKMQHMDDPKDKQTKREWKKHGITINSKEYSRASDTFYDNRSIFRQRAQNGNHAKNAVLCNKIKTKKYDEYTSSDDAEISEYSYEYNERLSDTESSERSGDESMIAPIDKVIEWKQNKRFRNTNVSNLTSANMHSMQSKKNKSDDHLSDHGHQQMDEFDVPPLIDMDYERNHNVNHQKNEEIKIKTIKEEEINTNNNAHIPYLGQLPQTNIKEPKKEEPELKNASIEDQTLGAFLSLAVNNQAASNPIVEPMDDSMIDIPQIPASNIMPGQLLPRHQSVAVQPVSYSAHKHRKKKRRKKSRKHKKHNAMIPIPTKPPTPSISPPD